MAKIPADVIKRVREVAKNRCGYCLTRQDVMPQPLEIDHIKSKNKGGTDEESNLWLACRSCNRFKSNKLEAIDPETKAVVRLFNPREQDWFEHFKWSDDGLNIIGLTPTGRAMVDQLRLNTNTFMITARTMWKRAGWHPPTE
jgi:hypothetical protein